MVYLSCIGLFSTVPKFDNFCAKKKTFGTSPLSLSKILVAFWSHALLQTDFSSDYMGRIRNKLINAAGLIYVSFFKND